MRDILIIAHFSQAPNEAGNGRFNYIASLLVQKYPSYDIEICTSSFSHTNKQQREISQEDKDSIPYLYTILKEPGYKKNVSLSRFYSHYIWGRNLKKYLDSRKKPDIIYCAIPSFDAGFAVMKYAKKHNIKVIIDIQDLWPEAFQMVFTIPVLSSFIFYPFKALVDYIYSSADSIIAVSDTYLQRAMTSSDKRQGSSVYLGTDLAYFDSLKKTTRVPKPENEIWLAYIGTLGHSYDIKCVIDALSLIKNSNKRIKFVVLGDGPLKEKFEKYANNKLIYSNFTGKLAYPEMVSLLCNCDIAVNPIQKKSAGSIINKVGDYASASLPVINTQECQEYRHLIEKYACGINCDCSNSDDVAKAMIKLVEDKNLRMTMGLNNRKLAENKFDRNKSYLQIIKTIQEVMYDSK